jgi:GMP synthase (glutamine-hydrolysing)
MDVVAFRHMYSEGLGSLGTVIEKAGGNYRYIDTYRESLDGFDPLLPDLLIVLGGTPGVYQADDYPFLKDEMKMIEARLKAERPVFGICLGAQMMASVLGSKVYRGKRGPEIGWFPVEINEAGQNSPLRHFTPELTHVLCWHGDTFDLPENSVCLASSAKYENQAYRYGKNALGLQFHCEITPQMVKGWSVSGAGLVADGVFDIHRLRDDTESYGPKLMGQSERALNEWMRSIGIVSDA